MVRVDPGTRRVIDRFPTPGNGALAVGGGSVWQAGITTQTIYRYDPSSTRQIRFTSRGHFVRDKRTGQARRNTTSSPAA